ncbi:Serpentine Receptor, class BC (Class B-like) [Caenorhabditis elegans]|uniref:Serpentine Receptor, class BC (Class B-like) n=1 Tax=Caenorhabditis elegans TaxID=6239 RepID=Q9N4Q8_CAEEL|nr:Serpentine Receptor, class BC (Class B-like) [Caenorhabditis elegans]CCD67435.1 Serpentine Receptor, class BC (Class B-like) [Caenorhabditis elegans]|eukprot:NP_503596.2 Serpentine Receptor, class BC (class B-like) [Caenorhabditis elegans]
MDNQPIMNVSALIVTAIGVFSSLFAFAMNIYILKNFERKKNDMALFRFRFFLDVVLGSTTAVYLASMGISAVYIKESTEFANFVFHIGFFTSNIGVSRSLITLAISIERFVAVYFPILFLQKHPFFPNSVIPIIAIGYGVFEYPVLYSFCNFELNIPYGCVTLSCSLNLCFYQYWTTYKTIVYILTFLSTIVLTCKLLLKIHESQSNNLTRANRLALIDCIVIFLFDFFPILFEKLVTQKNIFTPRNLGSYSTVTKLSGCAVEAFLVYRTVIRKQDFVNEATTSKVSSILVVKKVTS